MPGLPSKLSTCPAFVALQAWFHLYRILLTADDLAPAEVAPTVEQFMQVGRVAASLMLPALPSLHARLATACMQPNHNACLPLL